MARDDSANLFVLESIIIAILLLGAAYTMRSLQEPTVDAVRPRTELGRLTHDALTVLHGMDDGNGTALLDLYVAQAWHCAYDAVPSLTDCDGRRSKNLSIKIENYLPLGAGWALEIGNGADTREIYRSPLPQGEAVAASLSFGPEWNLTFMATELSCYDPGADINLTLVPIDRGAFPWSRWGNVTIGTSETPGQAATAPRWWNVTLPGATRAPSATVIANVTGNATLRGATSYDACDLHGRTAELRAALLASTFTVPASAPVGGTATFTAQIAPLQALPDASVTSVTVAVYEPLPGRNATADTYIEAGTAVLTQGSGAWNGAWEVSPSTLYGKHPALLRVAMLVGGTEVELRKVASLDIALATGEVPIDPPYRAVLQTWLADWG